MVLDVGHGRMRLDPHQAYGAVGCRQPSSTPNQNEVFLMSNNIVTLLGLCWILLNFWFSSMDRQQSTYLYLQYIVYIYVCSVSHT